MRVSIGLSESPRQYAPASDWSLKALIGLVVCRCGPRQRSSKPSWVYRLMSPSGSASTSSSLYGWLLGGEATLELVT